MQADKFRELIEKYLDERIQEGEKQLLASMLQDQAYIKMFDEMVLELLTNRTYELETSQAIKASIDQYLHEQVNATREAGHSFSHAAPQVRLWNTAWFRVAAVIIVVLGIAIGFLMSDKSTRKEAPVLVNGGKLGGMDVAPGHEGAVLTIANGEKIVLDSLDNGVVATQSGTLMLLNNGALSYDHTNASAVNYHTLTTPRGRQFQLRLPDGSKVWLNAASSIIYPTVFTGKERLVQITGEAYFEIEKDAAMPFRVKVDDQVEIAVLGTRFNVKAYPDDKTVQTTLLAGAVRVDADDQHLTMKPGEQALLQTDGHIVLTGNVDVEKAVAWKEGIFYFEEVPFAEIMHQLERWYDIEVKYAGPVPSLHFKGKLPQDLTLSQVTEALKEVGVNFSIEGRTLTVMP